MMKSAIAFLVISAPLLAGCLTSNSEPTAPEGVSVGDSLAPTDWLIPKSQVRDGGPGKDGIPALEDPQFISVAEAAYLAEDDLVIGVKVGSEARAYPHRILDWHEIINDRIAETYVAVTYCPLTGSSIGWDRDINGTQTTFGVSGLLYNTNLMPYDRLTDSYWSQMELECVNGPLIGTKPKLVPIIETTWATWKMLYPDSKVVSNNTSVYVPSLYQRYPYGDYRTNDTWLLFPVNRRDSRLPAKERTYGVISGDSARIYRFRLFTDQVTTLNDTFLGTPIVVAGSELLNFIVAYQRKLDDGTVLTFQPYLRDSEPAVMIDGEGTKWSIFGEALDGPRAGTQLRAAPGFIAFWFSWAPFFPEVTIVSAGT